MSPLKQHIHEGEELLAKYQHIIRRIDTAPEEPVGIKVLLDIEKIQLEKKITNIEGKLSQARKQYMEEFEKDSAECNLRMEEILSKAKKYLDREPKGISDKLSELIKRWEFAKDDIEQEEKNDIYFEVEGIIGFFKKQKNNL